MPPSRPLTLALLASLGCTTAPSVTDADTDTDVSVDTETGAACTPTEPPPVDPVCATHHEDTDKDEAWWAQYQTCCEQWADACRAECGPDCMWICNG